MAASICDKSLVRGFASFPNWRSFLPAVYPAWIYDKSLVLAFSSFGNVDCGVDEYPTSADAGITQEEKGVYPRSRLVDNPGGCHLSTLPVAWVSPIASFGT